MIKWIEAFEEWMTPERVKRGVGTAIFGYFSVFFLVLVGMGAYWSEFIRIPEQPINFSHEIHVHDNKLPCATCHQLADGAITAGIPSVETCMTCHESLAADRPEVQKIHAAWNSDSPIVWERIHNVPDHVFFSHERHIQAGVDCASCHGQIEAMPVVKQVRSLEMGMCVDCHRLNEAPLECLTCHQ